MRRTVAVLLVSLVALAGCGDDGEPTVADGDADTTTAPTTDDPFAGRTFVADGETIVAGTTVTLTFRDGAVIAETGCNRLSGQYAVADTTLTATDVTGTEMECEPELMAQEQLIRELLQRTNEIAEVDGTITLAGDGETWVLTEQGQEPVTELVGPAWALDTLVDGESASSVPEGVTAAITFAADGTYSVEAGCNSGSGTYTEAGAGTYQVEAPALTRRRCDDAATEVESAVVDVLDGDVAVVIEGDRLTITTSGEGATGLGFTAG